MFSFLPKKATRTQKLLFAITRPSFTSVPGFIQIFGIGNLKVTSPSSSLEKFTNQLRSEFQRNDLKLTKVAVFHYRSSEISEWISQTDLACTLVGFAGSIIISPYGFGFVVRNLINGIKEEIFFLSGFFFKPRTKN